MQLRLNALGVFLFLALLTSLNSCKKAPETEPLFELLPSDYTGINFTNQITESDSLSILTFDYIYNGAGVAIGDINQDSLPDIYFSGNQSSGMLYLNKGNLQFEDITQVAGVGTSSWSEGVTMVDINNDGWLDIYICTSSRDAGHPGGNLLFINQGLRKSGSSGSVPTFKEMSVAYGLHDTGFNTQAAFLDYDSDGDLDMYLLNNAIESFNKNSNRPRRLDGTGTSTDKLYRNEGVPATLTHLQANDERKHPVFVNVSREEGILVEGYGLGIGVSDLNMDGRPDVYTSNDFLSNDVLYINQGKKHSDAHVSIPAFSNQIARLLKHQSYNGMGVDIADINNDALPDIIVLDMLPETNLRQKLMFGAVNYDRFRLNLNAGYEPQYVRNTLQLNNGPRPISGEPSFSEIAQLAGVYATDWSWSALFADYDNDGFRDLFITNGYGKDITDLDYTVYSRAVSQFGTEEHIKMQLLKGLEKIAEVKMPNYLYRNNGNLTFADKSEAWGMTQVSISNGASYADLDNDGDLDLVVNNLNNQAFVYRNNADKVTKNSYLKVKLNGSVWNKAGIGTKVLLRYGGQKQYAEQYTSRGYKSSIDPIIHFGLGKRTIIDSVEITWPDGKYQLLRNVPCNQQIEVEYAHAQTVKEAPVKLVDCLFREVGQSVGINYRHEENDFADFRVQPLLPVKHSLNGPGIAVADINGDGLEDFFVGGASGKSGQLFRQDQQGNFSSSLLRTELSYEEDMGALFFDADNDQDQDLFVVSGGSEFSAGSKYYHNRLYKNDGKGGMQLDTHALPAMDASGSCIIAADYDQDGDLDLLVGGRVSPAQYPMPPRSYILENQGGTFKNVTSSICPELSRIGMITSALWTDFDHDQHVDLIVVGEWMPVTFFKNTGGKLINVTSQTGLAHTTGWWNSISGADFDNDGDVDYVLGNLGLNSKYKATVEEPVALYAKDYDGNGSIDPILTQYIGHKNHPARPRDDMIDQVVSLRRRFPHYADYANATFDEIFTSEEIKGAYVLQARQLASCYLENIGKNGTAGTRFRMKVLPVEAQFAPVFGILPDDFDGDGNTDVLLTGNSYASDILTGWYDASTGIYLKGNGKGGFTSISASQSGFFVDKDAKGLAQLFRKGRAPLLLAACNNDSLKVFQPLSTPRQLIEVQPMDVAADIVLHNGKKRRIELYYGSGYLSQSSRRFALPTQASRVIVYDYLGRARTVFDEHKLTGKQSR